MTSLRKLLAYDFGDESDHCIELATAAGEAADKMDQLVEGLREDRSFLEQVLDRGATDDELREEIARLSTLIASVEGGE